MIRAARHSQDSISWRNRLLFWCLPLLCVCWASWGAVFFFSAWIPAELFWWVDSPIPLHPWVLFSNISALCFKQALSFWSSQCCELSTPWEQKDKQVNIGWDGNAVDTIAQSSDLGCAACVAIVCCHQFQRTSYWNCLCFFLSWDGFVFRDRLGIVEWQNQGFDSPLKSDLKIRSKFLLSLYLPVLFSKWNQHSQLPIEASPPVLQ